MTTIDDALDAFLAEQDTRLAERTYRNYLQVIELFRDCMNGYGSEALSELERRRWQQAFDAGDEQAFTRLFGPEKIPEQVGQFLGWFVIRKVMAGQELLKACGTVTKKLGKWLDTNGYIDASDAADMAERGSEAGDELPKAERLAGLLYDQARSAPTFDGDSIPDDDWIEDQLWIERVEPGVLWFDGGVGPVKVPKKASDLARPGWAVTLTLAKVAGEWDPRGRQRLPVRGTSTGRGNRGGSAEPPYVRWAAATTSPNAVSSCENRRSMRASSRSSEWRTSSLIATRLFTDHASFSVADIRATGAWRRDAPDSFGRLRRRWDTNSPWLYCNDSRVALMSLVRR